MVAVIKNTMKYTALGTDGCRVAANSSIAIAQKIAGKRKNVNEIFFCNSIDTKFEFIPFIFVSGENVSRTIFAKVMKIAFFFVHYKNVYGRLNDTILYQSYLPVRFKMTYCSGV